MFGYLKISQDISGYLRISLWGELPDAWDLVVSLCLPLSCDDGSWILMYKFQFLNLGISTHIRQIVVRVSSAHSSDFPHVFGDEDHPQNSVV